MSEIEFKFDPQKAVEVIIYIAQRIPQPTFLSVAKLMYFADKTSLELYGRFISGDTYCAMKNGPVPSSSYDIMKEARTTDHFGFQVEHECYINPKRDADLDEFSDSDQKCLDRIIELYGKYPNWRLIEISHDAAWTSTWEQAGQVGSTPIPVERIINTLDEADDLLDYLHNQHSD